MEGCNPENPTRPNRGDEPLANRTLPRAIDRHVGHRLRAIRIERGFAQHDLANLLTQPVEQIAAYEDGDLRIPSSGFLALTALLGTTIAYFFEEFRPPGQRLYLGGPS